MCREHLPGGTPIGLTFPGFASDRRSLGDVQVSELSALVTADAAGCSYGAPHPTGRSMGKAQAGKATASPTLSHEAVCPRGEASQALCCRVVTQGWGQAHPSQF